MESDRDILIRVDQKVTDMHQELLGKDGRVPVIEKELKKQGEQIHFWRGGLALAGLLLIVFGAILWAHLSGGAEASGGKKAVPMKWSQPQPSLRSQKKS